MELGNNLSELNQEKLLVLHDLNKLEKNNSLEFAQKLKLKWSMEGDENSCFFHAYLKRRRRSLAIGVSNIMGCGLTLFLLLKIYFLSITLRDLRDPWMLL
jgi:hypothetical protein